MALHGHSLGKALKKRGSSHNGNTHNESLIDRTIDAVGDEGNDTPAGPIGDRSILSSFRSEGGVTGTNPVNEDRARSKTRRKAMSSLAQGFASRSTL